jgi:RNA-directed DNA polymerase
MPCFAARHAAASDWHGPKFHAAVAAGSPTGCWRMSGHPAVQQALRNHYLDSLGLPRLHVSVSA